MSSSDLLAPRPHRGTTSASVRAQKGRKRKMTGGDCCITSNPEALPAVRLWKKGIRDYIKEKIQSVLKRGTHKIDVHTATALTTAYPPPMNEANRDSVFALSKKGVGLLCVADGCGLHRSAQLASTTATSTFESFFTSRIHELNSVQQAGHLLRQCVGEIQRKIAGSPDLNISSGQTTFLAAVVMRKHPAEVHAQRKRAEHAAKVMLKHTSSQRRNTVEGCDTNEESKQNVDDRDDYVAVGIMLGDCQAWMRSGRDGRVIKVSSGEREDVHDPAMPAGWLGDAGNPEDARLFFLSMKTGDILLLMTDGITDNINVDDLRDFSNVLDLDLSENPSRLATPILNAAFKKVAPITKWMTENSRGRPPPEIAGLGKVDDMGIAAARPVRIPL